MNKRSTIKVYDGPSMLDGKRVIVLLTGLAKSSANTKTGDMLQTWIMLYDTAPHEAIKTGDDSSVCGNCPLRPYIFKRTLEADRVSPKPCYVLAWQAPLKTWKANRDLDVTPREAIPALIAGRIVRGGSYGDPNAVPAWVWTVLNARTGYTHQWSTHPALQDTVMASVHSNSERRAAKALGFRTFRIIADVAELRDREILCPASKEAGARTTCAKCGLCDGKRGENDRRKDVAIVAH